ncbi:MAG: flagellar FliL protein [Gammaproteobacteria bacterium]|jgi:flagellar FliL protein
MADQDVQLSDDVPKTAPLKWIIAGVAGSLIVVGGVLGTLFGLGILGSDEAVASANAEQAEDAEPVKKEAIYLSLEPSFTVNFQDDGPAKFLQISLDVLTRDSDVPDQVRSHMPVIRNELVMLFGDKTSSELATAQGKETLQTDALKAIQRVLETETGSPGVESVYFTTFVMQ